MKVLVIGNSGFIGNCLCSKLINAGYEIAGLDVKSPDSKQKLCNFVLGDILNTQDIMNAIEGVDVIIHLAAKHHDFGVPREEFFKVNEQGMKNVLECAAKAGINKFIFYSSVAVYGDVKAYSTEATAINPASDYGESKLAAEKVLLEWVEQDPTRKAVIIRPTVVFGPNNYANMFNLVDKIYKGKFIFVGKGDNIKSVAYVENLVDATIFALERMKPGIEIYNYSDYPQLTTEEIVKIVTRHLGCKIPKLRIPLKPAVALASVIDILGRITGYNFPITAKRIKKFNTATYHKSDKIREVGFKPPVDLSEGFRKMVDWYVKEGRFVRQIVRKTEENES